MMSLLPAHRDCANILMPSTWIQSNELGSPWLECTHHRSGQLLKRFYVELRVAWPHLEHPRQCSTLQQRSEPNGSPEMVIAVAGKRLLCFIVRLRGA